MSRKFPALIENTADRVLEPIQTIISISKALLKTNNSKRLGTFKTIVLRLSQLSK